MVKVPLAAMRQTQIPGLMLRYQVPATALSIGPAGLGPATGKGSGELNRPSSPPQGVERMTQFWAILLQRDKASACAPSRVLAGAQAMALPAPTARAMQLEPQ